MLDRCDEEEIIYKAILAKKVVPKSSWSAFKENWRYFLITDDKLYTLDQKRLDAGDISKNDVVKKKFDLSEVTHISFLCPSEEDQERCMTNQMYNEASPLPEGYG